VAPRLVLRHARACAPHAIEVLGEPEDFLAVVLDEVDAPLEPWPPERPVVGTSRRTIIDRHGAGMAGVLADLVGTGEPVLAVCASVPRRLPGLQARLGGFALCAWAALERKAVETAPFAHLVALDPPAHAHLHDHLATGPVSRFAHLAWGSPELRFAQQIHEQELALRAPLAALYRALRDRGGAEGEELEAVLRGDGPHTRSPALAGRLVRVLAELHLVSLDRDRPALEVPAAQRTALERSAAFRAYTKRYEDGLRFLTDTTAQAA
jgi:single-stranded-DNA-specific exonuclease